MKEYSGLNMKGSFVVTNLETGEVILQKDNSINYENISIALARCLSGQITSQIFTMVFGNGGSVVNGTGAITYLPPNTSGSTASLYNQTYEVTGLTGATASTSALYDPNNTIEVNHMGGMVYSDIIVICTLGYNQPSDQSAFDNTNIDGNYVFDEIGLMTQDGTLLTHAIFSPTTKALNVSLQIQYTLRISMC